LGNWEADTILGKGRRGAIVTLTERRSRLALIRKVERRKADCVQAAITELLLPLKALVHTLTADNGKEFAEHEKIACDLDTDFFFAHPYSAWDRGANENMNGLLRQYFPKNRDFTTITQEEIELAMNLLNNRPRKCLDFMTPLEVFFNQPVALDI
jgi:IS30 family transposase